MARKRPAYGRDQEYVPQYPPQVRKAPVQAGGIAGGPRPPKRPVAESPKPLLERDLGDGGRRLQAYVEGRLDGSLKRKPGKASKILTPAVTFTAATVLVLVLFVGGALLLAAGVQQPAPKPDPSAAVSTVPTVPAGTEPASSEGVVQVEDATTTRSGARSSGSGSLSPEQAEAARERAVPPPSSEAPPQ